MNKSGRSNIDLKFKARPRIDCKHTRGGQKKVGTRVVWVIPQRQGFCTFVVSLRLAIDFEIGIYSPPCSSGYMLRKDQTQGCTCQILAYPCSNPLQPKSQAGGTTRKRVYKDTRCRATTARCSCHNSWIGQSQGHHVMYRGVQYELAALYFHRRLATSCLCCEGPIRTSRVDDARSRI